MTAAMNDEFSVVDEIEAWSRDIAFVQEALEQKKLPVAQELLGQLDLDKIIAGGHSLGGNVALGLDQYLPELLGAFNLDGGSWDIIESRGLQVPSLILRSYPLYSDEELEEKGRSRAGWDAMGRMIDSIHTRIYTRSGTDIVQVQIKGTGHMSFTDAPYYLPDLISRFGGRIREKESCRQLVREYVLGFLNAICEEGQIKVPKGKAGVLVEVYTVN